MRKIVIAYVPVLHEGYRRFFAQQEAVDQIYILGSDVIAAFAHLRKDVRAIQPEVMAQALQATVGSQPVSVLDLATIKKLQQHSFSLLVPDEDIMHTLVETYFGKYPVTYVPVFLRWDKQHSLQQNEVQPDLTILATDVLAQPIERAQAEAAKSEDWWRQVGAALVKDGQLTLVGYNHHLPDAQVLAYQGDPRGNFHKGQNIELSTAFHAEATVVAEAAKQGISLAGADLYVTTFPCPYCAKLLAHTGLGRLFYVDGYSMIDGADILRHYGVQLVKIKMGEEE